MTLTPYTERHRALRYAETKAAHLFAETEARGLIRPGVSEKVLNTQIYELAFELYGIRKYWHKRIVRAGRNTLEPYREKPPGGSWTSWQHAVGGGEEFNCKKF